MERNREQGAGNLCMVERTRCVGFPQEDKKRKSIERIQGQEAGARSEDKATDKKWTRSEDKNRGPDECMQGQEAGTRWMGKRTGSEDKKR